MPTDPSRPAPADLERLRAEESVPLDTVFRRVTEAAAAALGVERAGVWLLVDGGTALRCFDLFERSTGAHTSGTTLRTGEFPDYFAAVARRRPVPADEARTDPRTCGLADAYLVPLGITSMLDAPLFVAGEVVGVLCHEHVGAPREWSPEQREFAGSMADLLSLKLRAAESADPRGKLLLQAEQMTETRRAGAMAEAAAGVAHDFNNILAVMIGGAEVIAAAPDCPPALAAFARNVVEAGERGAALARTLTEFARPGPRASRVVRPAEVVAGQLGILRAAAPGHSVRLDVRPGSGRSLIDPDQLERAVLNMVLNARDCSPTGAEIAVAVGPADGDEAGRSGRYVVVEVRDAGTGIAPEVLPRVFEPFFTTKPRGEGTGVGLAVVRDVAEYAGGFVRVETAVGRGSAFRLYLPSICQL